MGFFDRRDKRRRRGRDDFNSPVEEIDLSAPRSIAPQRMEPSAEEFDPPTDQVDLLAPEYAATTSLSRYGVDQAIELLQSLPQDNLELAVQIVKQTLESTSIQIRPIIEEAEQRLEYGQSRAAQLVQEIAKLEHEIAWRKTEIENLTADCGNVTVVRKRLLMAEELGQRGTGDAVAAEKKSGTPPKVSPPRSAMQSMAAAAPAAKQPRVETYEPTEEETDPVTEVNSTPDMTTDQLESALKAEAKAKAQEAAKAEAAADLESVEAKAAEAKAASEAKADEEPASPDPAPKKRRASSARGRKVSAPPPIPPKAQRKTLQKKKREEQPTTTDKDDSEA